MKGVSKSIILVPIFLLIIFAIFLYEKTMHELNSPPKFCIKDFTELSKIEYISKFRSHTGHDYSDSFEHDRSMKHYYCPKREYGNSDNTIKVFSPVNGRISYIRDENHTLSNGEIQGKQIGITVDKYPSFEIILFHINPIGSLKVGERVSAGQLIGYADTRDNSCFDIAVRKSVLYKEKLYSYFQVITNEVFAQYQKHGIVSRNQMIIPKEIADNFKSNDPEYWKKRHESDWVKLE